VASEDTVLYTAQQYVNSLPEAQCDHAAEQLSPLIRCQHMSAYWLSVSVLCEGAPGVLLARQQSHVRRMLSMRIADPQFEATPSSMARLLPGAAESWSLDRHKLKLVESVQLTWRVNVSELRDAVNRSAETKGPVRLRPPSILKTPPLGGLAWKFHIVCQPESNAEEQAIKISAVPGPVVAMPELSDQFYKCVFELALQDGIKLEEETPLLSNTYSIGFVDAFGTGPMVGGWDETKWAAKGWPASGVMPITLTATKICHEVWDRFLTRPKVVQLDGNVVDGNV
jgi:hypothetical protein